MELVIAANPDPDSRLGYLLWVPLGDGLLFRAKDTWPRTTAVFCYPVELDEWPNEPEILERVPIRSCARRGAAIDLVLDRGRENRSQLVYTRARGREAVFWQSPKTRKKARPNVRIPTARAAAPDELEITIDAHEQYPYHFADKPVTTVRRALSCGDYAVHLNGRLTAAIERKSLPDLATSLTTGKLAHAIAELASLPRATVVIEERYSQIFTLQRVRPATIANGLTELQVRYPMVPIFFCETRPLAEDFTYRYLAAAATWAADETAATVRTGLTGSDLEHAPETAPSTSEVRAWARQAGLAVSDRGRLRPEIWQAWRQAHPR